MPTGPEPTPALVVSACLLGVRCNHRGEASPSQPSIALGRGRRLVPICPETLGGLPTPRPAAELQPDGSVRTADGEDVTAAYLPAAPRRPWPWRGLGATEAVLKARSPVVRMPWGSTTARSVGPGWPAMGVAAAALAAAGVAVRSEEDVAGALTSG